MKSENVRNAAFLGVKKKSTARKPFVSAALRTAQVALDASAVAGGTLEFDFKQVSPPPDGSQWHVKLESSGAATAVDILMTAGGNPTPGAGWQTYSFDLDIELAGLDLSDLKLVLFFPDWENANGAVARIDNIRLVQAL